MPYSYKSYKGNGVTKAFPIPFGYLLPRNIYVSVDTVVKNSTSDYSITTSNVTFLTPPAASSVILIQRHTDAATLAVNWEPGSILTEPDMNLAFIQQFYLIQELLDGLAVVRENPSPTPNPTPDTPDLIRRMFLFFTNHTTITYP
jgi:hypothetical protein